MARPRKDGNVVQFGDAPKEGSNQMTLERACQAAAEVIAEIEREQAKIDEVMEDAKAKIAPQRDAIARLKKSCRDDYGIEAKPLAIHLADRRQQRRILVRINALQETGREQFEQIEMAFERLEGSKEQPAPAAEGQGDAA